MPRYAVSTEDGRLLGYYVAPGPAEAVGVMASSRPPVVVPCEERLKQVWTRSVAGWVGMAFLSMYGISRLGRSCMQLGSIAEEEEMSERRRASR
jgi:hypothetical protein